MINASAGFTSSSNPSSKPSTPTTPVSPISVTSPTSAPAGAPSAANPVKPPITSGKPPVVSTSTGAGSTGGPLKPKKKFSWKMIAGVAVMLFVVIGLGAALALQGRVTSIDPRACNWECNSCGCGCSDYFDARPECRNGSGGGGGSTGNRGCDNGVAHGGTACQANGQAVQYRCNNGTYVAENCASGQTCQGTACTAGGGGGSNSCDSSATTAVACRGKEVGFNAGPCVCQRGTASATACGCVVPSGTTGLGVGQPCSTNSNCASNTCTNNVCAAGGSTTPTACTAGTCVNGKLCQYDPTTGQGYVSTTSCVTGCNNNDAACPSGQWCSTNTCTNKLVNGTACSRATQCTSGICTNGVCSAASGGTNGCTAVGQSCTTTSGVAGYCGSLTVLGQTTLGCSAKKAIGASCGSNYECSNNQCRSGFCGELGSDIPPTCSARQNAVQCNFVPAGGTASCRWVQNTATGGGACEPLPANSTSCILFTGQGACESQPNSACRWNITANRCEVNQSSPTSCTSMTLTQCNVTGDACNWNNQIDKCESGPAVPACTPGSCISGKTCDSNGNIINIACTSTTPCCVGGQNRTLTAQQCYSQGGRIGQCAAQGGSGTGGVASNVGGACTNPGGGTIAKYQKFVCNKCNYYTASDGVAAWRCDTLVEESSTEVLHLEGDECGQVDQINTQGNYCGYATADYNCNLPRCQGTPPSTPGVTPSPSPAGPMCLNITLAKIGSNGQPSTDTSAPAIGDAVRFTCATVPTINNYTFRVIEPDGTIVPLQATGNNSAIYNITKSGKFSAQCQICTGTAANTCKPFATITN